MYDFVERHGGGKVFKWGFCLLAVVLIAVITMQYVFSTHYMFEGKRLTLSSIGTESVVMVDGQGNEARFTGPSELQLSGGMNTVSYLGRTFSRMVDWNETRGYRYDFSDGTSSIDPILTQTFGEGDDALTPLQRDESNLIDRMGRYLADGHSIWIAIGRLFAALLALVLGVAMFAFPEALWKLDTLFTVRGGEPTEWALFSNQIGGILMIMLAFVIPFVIN